MATLDFYAASVTTLTSGGAGPADWAASSGTRASCLQLDDGTNIIQAVRSHASDTTTYYFICSDWRCVDDDVPIAEKLAADWVLLDSAPPQYAMTLKRTGGNTLTRFDTGSIRMLIGAETYAGATDQTHAQLSAGTSYAEAATEIAIDSVYVTLARLRDPTMRVQGIGAIRTNGASLEVDQFVIRVTYAGPAEACNPTAAKSLRFNGSAAATGGLALVSPSGDVTPRYTDEPVTVVGVGTHGTLGSGQTTVYPYACGLGRNGEKLAVIVESPTPKLAILSDGTRVLDFSLQTAGGDKPTNLSDMLRATSADVSTVMFSPVAAVIHDGLIVVQCACYTYNGSGTRTDSANWTLNRTGLCWTYDNGTTWAASYDKTLTPATGTILALGNVWSLTGHTLALGASADRDELWVAFTNYAGPNNIGIQCRTFMARFAWDGEDWASDGALLVPGSAQTIYPGTIHFHGACVYAFGDGLGLDYARGDGIGVHAILRMTRGDTDYMDTATEISGASGFYEVADATDAGWDDDAPRTVHGGLVGEFATTQSRVSMQPFGLRRDGYGIVLGCDETWSAFMRYAYPTTGAPDACVIERMDCGANGYANIRGVGGTINGVGRLAFTPQRADCWSEYPAMAAVLTPGDQSVGSSDTRQANAARIMYRPANTDCWCVVDAPTFSGGAEVTVGAPVGVWPDGMLLLPNTGAGTTIRTLIPGSSLAVRPLVVSPGGTSLLRTTSLVADSVATGNTFTVDYDWTLEGAPAPPVASPIAARCAKIEINNVSGNGAGGLVYGDASDWPDPTGKVIQVVLWVYPIGPKGFSPRVRLFDPDDAGNQRTDYTRFLAISANQWTRVSFEVSPSEAAGAAIASTWRLGIYFDNAGSGAAGYAEGEALVYFESVHQTDTGRFVTKELAGTGDGSDGYTATPDDDFEVTGLGCTKDYWTVGMVLRRPEHGADSTAALFTGDEPLATLWESNTQAVEVWAALDDRKLTITYPDGTEVADIAVPEHMRGDPVFIWIVRDYATVYAYFSVGGQQIYAQAIASGVADAADFNPTKIKLGQNADGSVVGAVDVLSVFNRDCYAATAGQVAQHMAEMAMGFGSGFGRNSAAGLRIFRR